MRAALKTLPWVEQESIQTDTDKREVRFNLKDKGQFNVEAVKKALDAQGFPEADLKAGP